MHTNDVSAGSYLRLVWDSTRLLRSAIGRLCAGATHGRRALLAAALLSVAVAGAAACKASSETPQSSDFHAFALEVADALAHDDVERLIAQTTKVRFTCDARTASSSPCANLSLGSTAEGFDVKFQNHGDEATLLDGTEMRTLLEGLQNADVTAPPDQFGEPSLEIYSTLLPDQSIFYDADKQKPPLRGTLAITYVGLSPGEHDDTVKRRLFAAIGEADHAGVWRIRLWLVGFYTPAHPAFHPGDGNSWKRWSLS